MKQEPRLSAHSDEVELLPKIFAVTDACLDDIRRQGNIAHENAAAYRQLKEMALKWPRLGVTNPEISVIVGGSPSSKRESLNDKETLEAIADIVGKSCDEDEIMAVERVLASWRSDYNAILGQRDAWKAAFDEIAIPVASATKKLQKADAENLRLREDMEAAQTAFVILHEKWLTAGHRGDMKEAMDALAQALGRPVPGSSSMCKFPYGFLPCTAYKPVLNGELEACDICKPHISKIRALLGGARNCFPAREGNSVPSDFFLKACPFCKAVPVESPHWRGHYGCPTESCTAFAANIPPDEWNERVSNLTLTVEDWLKDHQK